MSSSGLDKPKVSLSCLQCQQRKKRCDKSQPCQSCKESGIACTAISRARLPRGRHAGRQSGIDLRQRVTRLEGLIACGAGFSGALPPRSRLDQDSGDRDMAWAAIGQEVVGIRELLDEDSLNDETSYPFPMPDESPVSGTQNLDILLFGDLSCVLESAPRANLSKVEVFALLDVYTRRIDPILKVTHISTLRILLLDCPVTPPAREALRFSVYFTAVCSLDEQECIEIIGTGKTETMARFRRGAEVCLSNASLLTTTDWTVLQAFIVYLAGLRTCQGPRSTGALIAMAIRLGQIHGLDAITSRGQSFDIETRRRVWWSLSILDLQAAFDGGSRPVLSGNEHDCLPPLHINDADICNESHAHKTSGSSSGFTDMTFASMTHAMLRAMRRLNHVSVGSDGQLIQSQDWTERCAMADHSARVIRHEYLQHCDPNVPFQNFTQIVGENMIANLQLLVRRPMHRFYSSGPPLNDDFDVFDVARNVVERGLQKHGNDAFKPWRWFSWAKWYALAVLLTELCKDEARTRAPRVWDLAEAGFAEYGASIEDRNLRFAMGKLMGKARSIRSWAGCIRKRSDIPAVTVQPSTISGGKQRREPLDTTPWTEEIGVASSETLESFCQLTSEAESDMLSLVNWDAFLVDVGDMDNYDMTNDFL